MIKQIAFLSKSAKVLAALFLFSMVNNYSAQAQQNITIRQLLDNMYKSISNTKTYAFDMTSKERFHGKYVETNMHFRINESPKKIYAKDLKTGLEILYAQGWNNNKLYVNTNGAPWFNVSVAPNGSQARKDNHHMVTTSGFAFTKELLQKTEKMVLARGEKVEDFLSIQGETTFDGRACYKVNMEYKEYSTKKHKVTKDIDLTQLCLDLCVPEYWVKERNNISFGIVKAGKELIVPTSYAKKVIFYVDKQNFLPLVQLLYDDKDLYEKYEYRNLQTNYKPVVGEWTENCKDYDF